MSKLKFFVVADTSDRENSSQLTIEKHEFDWDNKEDREAVEDHTPDEEKLKKSNFADACRNFLHEERVMDYQQGFMLAMILTEKQFKLLQNYKGA